mmetsp:Transcript_13920/g.30348  ORF Transcript_13920/g.30348 Transcript_13920/m.30348 type:complete len:151 (+) Transcript_13920:190-642(+)
MIDGQRRQVMASEEGNTNVGISSTHLDAAIAMLLLMNSAAAAPAVDSKKKKNENARKKYDRRSSIDLTDIPPQALILKNDRTDYKDNSRHRPVKAGSSKYTGFTAFRFSVPARRLFRQRGGQMEGANYGRWQSLLDRILRKGRGCRRRLC